MQPQRAQATSSPTGILGQAHLSGGHCLEVRGRHLPPLGQMCKSPKGGQCPRKPVCIRNLGRSETRFLKREPAYEDDDKY